MEPRGLMSTREMIERALGSCKEYPFKRHCLLDESDQVVAIQVEVQHVLPGVDPGCPKGWTFIDGEFNLPDGDALFGEFHYEREGIHGKEGKAVALILPLGEDRD